MNMKLVITNDDGIDAPGLTALRKAAESLGDPIVFAPAEEASGVSHRVTTDRAFRVEARDSTSFAIHGTPSDCSRIALHQLEDEEFWVLSGINNGGNLGVDVWHSGTVAAVREAVIHGRPGIAFSHYRRRNREIDWDRAISWVIPIIQDLIQHEWVPNTFWSVNMPCLDKYAPEPEVVYCPVDPSPLPLGYQVDEEHYLYHGNYHERERVPGCDVEACFNGKIAVSLVSLNC